MKLFIKLMRDIKQSIGQCIAFVLVIAVGAFFYTGLATLSDNISGYTKGYFEEHHLSDLNVYYDQIFKDDIADLSKIKGINKIEGRYTFDATQAFKDYKASLKIHSIPEINEINTPTIIEGSMPSKNDDLLLDSHYAKENHIQVGDKITITTNGKDLGFNISGLIENVEYAKKNETQDHKGYGVAYMAEEAIPEIVGGFYYNEVMIDANKGYDTENLGQAIEAQSKQLPYLGQVSKERTFNYSQVSQTIRNNKLMSRVIPFVLFMIEAVILFLTMSRMIDSQRNQVGIMKALGVRNRSIMLHYMGYPVLVGIIGSILGTIIAAVVFIPLITASIARAYSLPDITFSLSLSSVIPPILFSSAFGIVACYLSGRSILKERASQAMRPKPPKKMKQLLIERIPGIWSNISYSYKLIIRNIFLNKQKALASSVGVVVSTILLITAFGTQSALLKVANQVEDVYTYDLRVDYALGTSSDVISLPTGIKSSYGLSNFPVELITNDEKENATLVVTEKENDLIHFFDGAGNRIPLEDRGVLVPRSYADKYHISAGDMIQLKFTAPELKDKSVDLKVLNISTQYSNPSFYITPTYLKSLDIEYRPTSLLVEANSSKDLASIRNSLEQNPHVDAIADKSDLKKSAQYILKQNSFVFIMFIICAVILSFGAIYTISSINIYERSRELATLKVLGYQKGKINRLIFFENIILTTFAVIVSLPISGYVYAIVVKALSSTHQQIPDQLNIIIILVSILLAFLLTILSNLLLRGKVNKINMTESLKSIE
ncbi:ABC transporter permease [Paenibacillus lutimineralis]|uniref:ABC transporter permease n=1 Tax=Paenibacillus lutimineralis TaxID=2707005 RepID=A0A3Q9IAX9_9BACL|nr:FtsX-like permease family protein [Paenibacillus lutimineralis]AZS16755.1 ABC transporter permease [Paenibacillus lutimineralis]